MYCAEKAHTYKLLQRSKIQTQSVICLLVTTKHHIISIVPALYCFVETFLGDKKQLSFLNFVHQFIIRLSTSVREPVVLNTILPHLLAIFGRCSHFTLHCRNYVTLSKLDYM